MTPGTGLLNEHDFRQNVLEETQTCEADVHSLFKLTHTDRG